MRSASQKSPKIEQLTLLEGSIEPRAYVRPFLKWAGSKFRILEHVLGALPAGKRLVEPFVGSGAVFLNAGFAKNVASDANAHLIGTFRSVQHDVTAVLTECESLFQPSNNSEDAFYALRDEFNGRAASDDPRHAALFIYLNRHCFNGLCRFNRSGQFNVPFGRYSGPQIPRRELINFAERSARAEFRIAGFAETMSESAKGDVVYCDPPYAPLSPTSSFTAYSKDEFGADAQRELANEAKALAKRGIPVVISNHDTPFTRELYVDAELTLLNVQRFISADSKNRGSAPELIATFR
jgi:DNA adenine methylase